MDHNSVDRRARVLALSGRLWVPLLVMTTVGGFVIFARSPTAGASAQPVERAATSGQCFATPDNGATIFGTEDASAVQYAVTVAPWISNEVKVAGICAGVRYHYGTTQTVWSPGPITIKGGFTLTNWTTPTLGSTTILDALGLGRVISSPASGITLTNVTLQNGFAPTQTGDSPRGGGAAYVRGAAIFSHVNVLSSSAQYYGGGVQVEHTQADPESSFEYGRFENNDIRGGNGFGGQLYVNSGSVPTGDRVRLRAMSFVGPGDLSLNVWYVDVTNSILGQGTLGVNLRGNGYASIVNNTFAGPGSYAIYLFGYATVMNNIFSDVGIGVYDTTAHANFVRNLFYHVDITSTNPNASESIFADPRLVAPALRDMHLLPDSPAIDAGRSGAPDFDFDGRPRPNGSAPDIGAFEWYAPEPTATPTATATATASNTATPTVTPTATPAPTPTAVWQVMWFPVMRR